MRYTIGIKIFGVAFGLLVLMAVVTLLMVRMARDVSDELDSLANTYFPAQGAMAQAHVRSLEQGLTLRRLVIAFLEAPADARLQTMRARFVELGRQTDAELALARTELAERLGRTGDLSDVVAVARLDTRLDGLSHVRRRYEDQVAKLLAALEGRDHAEHQRLLTGVEELRDELNQTLDAARREMLRIATDAERETQRHQRWVVQVSLVVMAIAGLLGLGFAAVVSAGLVRPVRRLLDGTRAVREGQLDTMIPVTSRDEIGRLTEAFNHMIGELRAKVRIRETFGRYMDPRIVEGLIDRPELVGAGGERRVMTVLFCDMKGFTSLSEGMTPSGMVTVLNEYLTTMSAAIREHGGIIDKYIGDAIMAFWGPPFTGADEQARLACLAALAQLARLGVFREKLPELMGIRRGLPEVDMRIGISTGDVVVGNIGSDVSKSYTVMGDAVNLGSRLEGANKSYGTHVLVSEATARMAEHAIETREVDAILVVGKSEPQRVFEVLGRTGELDPVTAALRDRFAAGLAAYRRQAWAEARGEMEACLAAVPGDGPSRVFLARVAHLAEHPPGPDWNGVFALTEK